MSGIESIQGMIPALVTPLTEDRSLDEKAFCKLLDRVFDHGGNGAMVLGTAGEGTDVDKKTYERTIYTAVEAARGRGCIICGISTSEYSSVLDNARMASSAGATAVLCTPPFYHKMSQDSVEAFFTRLCDESPLPVMIYNMPACTQYNVEFESAEKLFEHPNLIGIKDSSGNMIHFQKLLRLKEKGCKVFMGRAPLILCALLLGATGSMTPIPNLAPELEAALHCAVHEGDIQNAKMWQSRIIDIVRLFSYTPNPISSNLKALMSGEGLCEPYTAGFIPTLSDEQAGKLHQLFCDVSHQA